MLNVFCVVLITYRPIVLVSLCYLKNADLVIFISFCYHRMLFQCQMSPCGVLVQRADASLLHQEVRRKVPENCCIYGYQNDNHYHDVFT